MELKEAVTILKTIDVCDLREPCDVTEEMYDEAICEVLEALEELQEENEKYRSGELLTANQVKSFEETTKKYYIHKDKIKEKIEELKPKLEETSIRREKAKEQEEQAVLWCIEIRLDERIKTYEELLKGE